MISSTLGAPRGGTTVGGHQGVESFACSLITPPNGCGGGGSCVPGIVVVALGEPGVPVTCWAPTGKHARRRSDVEKSAGLVLITSSPSRHATSTAHDATSRPIAKSIQPDTRDN